jgi:hypothetical protein
LLACKQAWGEPRVYFLGDKDCLLAMPAGWTDAAALDPFVALAAGRAHFRMEDLIRLVELVSSCRNRMPRRRTRLVAVKEKTPRL